MYDTNGRQRTQGKCERCHVRYVWTGRPLLKHACCPLRTCGERLARTSRDMKRWPTLDETPDEVKTGVQ